MEPSVSFNKEYPSVSIIVLTYNSSKYVIETLESAKSQTYQNIELIVTDDCSNDDTIEICRNWIEENKKCFVRTELITSQQNTGVTRNCNRGLHEAEGEWLRFLSGDDTLTNNAIHSYIEFSKKNTQTKCIFSNTNITDENGLQIGKRVCQQNSFFRDKRKHFIQMLKGPRVSTSGMFIQKNTLLSVGGFDERFEMHEDFPLIVNLAKNGVIFYYLNAFLYNYRKRKDSIWNDFVSSDPGSIGMRFYNSQKLFLELELLPAIRKEKLFFSYLRMFLVKEMEVKRITKNKSYKIYSFLYLITTILKHPRRYSKALIRKSRILFRA